MSMATLQCFLGIQRSVNTAIDHPSAALPRQAANLVAAQGVPGVNTDADEVSALDGRGHQRFECLVDDEGIAKRERGGCSQDVQPAGGDDRGTKRMIAGIDEENSHTDTSFREASTPELTRHRLRSNTKRAGYDDNGSLELLERSRRDHVWQRAKTIP